METLERLYSPRPKNKPKLQSSPRKNKAQIKQSWNEKRDEISRNLGGGAVEIYTKKCENPVIICVNQKVQTANFVCPSTPTERPNRSKIQQIHSPRPYFFGNNKREPPNHEFQHQNLNCGETQHSETPTSVAISSKAICPEVTGTPKEKHMWVEQRPPMIPGNKIFSPQRPQFSAFHLHPFQSTHTNTKFPSQFQAFETHAVTKCEDPPSTTQMVSLKKMSPPLLPHFSRKLHSSMFSAFGNTLSRDNENQHSNLSKSLRDKQKHAKSTPMKAISLATTQISPRRPTKSASCAPSPRKTTNKSLARDKMCIRPRSTTPISTFSETIMYAQRTVSRPHSSCSTAKYRPTGRNTPTCAPSLEKTGKYDSFERTWHDDIPEELWVEVMEYFSPVDLARFEQVSVSFRERVQKWSVWGRVWNFLLKSKMMGDSGFVQELSIEGCKSACEAVFSVDSVSSGIKSLVLEADCLLESAKDTQPYIELQLNRANTLLKGALYRAESLTQEETPSTSPEWEKTQLTTTDSDEESPYTLESMGNSRANQRSQTPSNQRRYITQNTPESVFFSKHFVGQGEKRPHSAAPRLIRRLSHRVQSLIETEEASHKKEQLPLSSQNSVDESDRLVVERHLNEARVMVDRIGWDVRAKYMFKKLRLLEQRLSRVILIQSVLQHKSLNMLVQQISLLQSETHNCRSTLQETKSTVEVMNSNIFKLRSVIRTDSTSQ